MSEEVKVNKYAARRKGENKIHAIEIACKRLSFNALQVLEKALDEKSTPELEYRWRIAAAKEILDRAWGRPKQSVEAKVEVAGVETLIEALNAAKKRVNS